MTDKEKLEKIKVLADAMYNRMQNLTTDTSGIRKAMYDYHQFIINEYYKEEPVSKDLEEAANTYIGHAPEVDECSSVYGKRQAFKAGAQWQKEHPWKPADGDDLPEIDREVIALLSNGTVVYAHRPQEYWDGRNIATGKVTRHYPKRHGKGGWNIPDVKFWLDCELPKMEE